MRTPRTQQTETPLPCRVACHWSHVVSGQIKPEAKQRTIAWCGRVLALLVLSAGCVHVPVSSDIVVNDGLQAIPPLEQGDVLLVYGENASPPEQSAIGSYFTAGCFVAFHGNTVGELIKTILKVNPQPGRFAVSHIKEVDTEAGADLTATGTDAIMRRLDLAKIGVSRDHLRYVIHVKENFEATAHMPLYASPFGLASCSNRTVLQAGIWDLQTERFIGSFSVSADGQFTVLAYLFHLVVSPDTQKDAMERFAREIVMKLTGLKTLEIKNE
jgi:hypothetical protein